MKKFIITCLIWLGVGIILVLLPDVSIETGSSVFPWIHPFQVGYLIIIVAVLILIFKPILDKIRKGLGSAAEKAKDSYTQLHSKNK